MVDFNRTEDKQAMTGTAIFYTLLIILLFFLGKSCTDVQAKDVDAGGVAISLGEPDQGGPDNSTAETQSTPPPNVPDYTPQSQLTSDDAEAPVVKETKPTPHVKTTKPVTEPTKTREETKPTPETKPERKANPNDLFKPSGKTGSGSGDPNGAGGDKGAPDGTGKDPNGDGKGPGLGSGPTSGPVVGKIGGFDADITAPRGGVQDNGVVRLYVCVNASGDVTTVRHEPLRGAPGTTTNSDLINRAISSIRQSSFRNVSGANSGCGYFTYTFQVR
jgi:hypothetical protein